MSGVARVGNKPHRFVALDRSISRTESAPGAEEGGLFCFWACLDIRCYCQDVILYAVREFKQMAELEVWILEL